jgi:hypothetical protein
MIVIDGFTTYKPLEKKRRHGAMIREQQRQFRVLTTEKRMPIRAKRLPALHAQHPDWVSLSVSF